MCHKNFHWNSYLTHYQAFNNTPKGVILIKWFLSYPVISVITSSLMYKIQLFYYVHGSHTIGIWMWMPWWTWLVSAQCPRPQQGQLKWLGSRTGVLIRGLPMWLGLPHSLDVVGELLEWWSRAPGAKCQKIRWKTHHCLWPGFVRYHSFLLYALVKAATSLPRSIRSLDGEWQGHTG